MNPLEVMIGTLLFGACIFGLALIANHRLSRLRSSASHSTHTISRIGSVDVFTVRRESPEGRLLEQIDRLSRTAGENK